MAAFLTVAIVLSVCAAASKVAVTPEQPAKLFPLRDLRLLESPFSEAVKANRQYLLAHDPDRLLAPFRREAGLEPKAQPYGNWESSGLDGHTAGHYLSAISLMMASGADPNGEFRRRLDYMIDELADIQKANGNGYIGGIPKSEEYWTSVADGRVELMRSRWAPWYNLHKMFAGLRDAYLNGGNEKARDLLVRYGDWCERVTSGLTDTQMQRMIATEYGGMNEVLADVYAITGDSKYIELAKRFNHRAVFEPLENHQDKLTGLHANTQIPKITGMERIAALAHDERLHTGAEFFWETVTRNRSVAFGGNSVSEHFNDPKDFSGMIGHREGPETCNTYNMLRLTEALFTAEPKAAYADFYERALYNHILASINPKRPGYVYFTPIRPAHYRVYSQPEQAFWCCVGTGMENPGRYGEFIYARAKDGVYVNLFIPSELSVPDTRMVLRQETMFPDEARTQLSLQLEKPVTFTLNIRHPGWVGADDFAVKVNGRSVAVESTPSSYAAIRREWNNGDRIEVSLPMRTTIERLPDGSDWVAIKHGPIVLASPCGEKDMPNLYADSSRMGHVASGPMVPLDLIPVILSTAEELPRHIVPDPQAGPLHFRLVDVVEPAAPKGMSLEPFFRLHDQRYQMYWQLTATAVQAESAFRSLAKTPPMGWNSWDCFGTTVTEEQAKAQADAMARYLKPYGWTYFTVDIQWYEPNSQGHAYRRGARLEMDEYSRLVPGLKKFPSSSDGRGFKPLADYVHANGLKFGIHIMRGISKQAVRDNTPILGTDARAADIANTRSFCPWNPDMWGVDMSKPGAQEYYDSLFQLYVSWGVDFVKVDDISRPYDENQKAEIEAIRKAIDKCGRPIVLSLSPGDTPIERGEHVMSHTNMWRISDDFWDRWPPLYQMFGRLDKWTKYRAEGAWPDADMLPFGIVEFNRPTRFTKQEQTLCMNLWCIARSPLILGADLTRMDEFTLNLLTNREVLAVNQDSVNNRQLSRDNDLIVWTADVPGSRDKYVAFFNAQDNSDPFDLSKADYRSRPLRGEPEQEVIEIKVPVNNARRLVLAIGDGGNGNFYDHAAWVEPTVTGSAGTLKLTALDWKLATAGWGQVRKNRTVDGRPLTLDGKEIEGIGTHAASVIEFELPEGYDTFTARGMITEGSQGRGRLEFLVLVNPDKRVQPERSRVAVSFANLGISGKANVRDLWARKDLGEFSGSFEQELALHSAGLYRISPIP